MRLTLQRPRLLSDTLLQEMQEKGDETKKTSDAPLRKIKFGRTKKAAKDSSKTQEQVKL